MKPEDTIKEKIVEEKKQQINKTEPKDTKTYLNINVSVEDYEIIMDALANYTTFLLEHKKRTNSIVIDESFNQKINAKIARTDEIKFLLKKDIFIVDKTKKLETLQDKGEVIGIETSIKLDNNIILTENKADVVGSTLKVKEDKKLENVTTSVLTVNEEL